MTPIFAWKRIDGIFRSIDAVSFGLTLNSILFCISRFPYQHEAICWHFQFEIRHQATRTEVIQSKEIKAKGIYTFRHFMESVWFEDAMFMNDLEGMQCDGLC